LPLKRRPIRSPESGHLNESLLTLPQYHALEIGLARDLHVFEKIRQLLQQHACGPSTSAFGGAG